MFGRPATVFLALLAGLLAPTSVEAARPQPVGHGAVLTDDVRYAVFVPQSGAGPRVIDTQTGALRQLATPSGYQLSAVGGGQALWSATAYQSFERHDPPLLTDLATGATREPVGWEQPWGEAPPPFAWTVEHREVGRYWIGEHQFAYHSSNAAYLNWRTGEYIYTDPGPATSRPNLDRPDLMEPICPPFKRKAAKREIDAIDPWLPIEYQYPYTTFRRDGRVRLARCGSRRSRVLFKTHDKAWCYGCGYVEDGYSPLPTRPVWAGGGRIAPIRAYLPRKRRTVTLAKMRRTPPGFIRIAQTRTRIFVTIRDSRVYSLPAPHG